MSTDPLPLSAMLTGPPDAAEYDAVHAAITASERGRWFLSEYANRNRHADTQMLVAAIARVEAAIRGDPPPHSPSLSSPVCRDLIAIAAAIERVAALIGTGAAPGPDGSAAAERVADIAFVLHERDVEASLCDALDAAVREFCDVCALNQAVAQRTQQAAELLRELASRVNDMMALSIADHRGEPPAAADAADAAAARPRRPQRRRLRRSKPSLQPAIADQAACEEATNHDEPPRAGLFEADLQEDEDFAQAVAALAASLPSLADPAEPASDPRREPADVIAEPPGSRETTRTAIADGGRCEDGSERGRAAALRMLRRGNGRH